MSPAPAPPRLVGDFGLVPLTERLEWKYGFARHIASALELPPWKKEEAVRPMAATIAVLVRQGLVSPVIIQQHILEAASRLEDNDNSSREHATSD